MILASRVASRIVSTGLLAALAALAVVLAGCGEDSRAKADEPVRSAERQVSSQRPEPQAPAADRRCRQQLGDFLDSMTTLRELLVTGLSYEEYVAELGLIRANYDEVPVNRLTLACLNAAGTPGERSFSKYIAAANAWGECIEEEGCDAAQVEPVLQKRWRGASHFLDEARDGVGQAAS